MKVCRILSYRRGDGSVNKITTLGVDLAKNLFQLHGVDRAGKVVLRREVRRAQLMKTIAQLEPCVIGIEACGGAHYWARRFAEHGHQVKMMSPQFVKPYRKSDKNDRNDAEAICEAVTRPSMRFVAVKSVERQDMLTLHRVREGLMKERTALINRIRGLLSEYGVVIAKSVSNLRRELPGILEDAGNELTVMARQIFNELYDDLSAREEQIVQVERSIRTLGSQHEMVRRLETVPGIGHLSATALFGTVGNARQYKNGRQLAAIRMLFDWLVVGQVVATNPAAPVRGPKYTVKKGKTPVLTQEEARELLEKIDTS